MAANFQSQIRRDMTSYIVGEIALGGPLRVEPKITNSTSAANNVFGRAFQQVAGAGNDSEVTADLTSDGVFAGILVNPKEHVTAGPSTGTLDPTLVLRNNENASFLKEGTVAVLLNGTAAVNIGDQVFYNFNDGTLTAVASGGNAPANHAAEAVGDVVRCNLAANSDRIALVHFDG